MNKRSLPFYLILLYLLIFYLWASVRSQGQSEVSIINYNSWLDAFTGWFFVVGEVQNMGVVPVDFVKIDALFYDENGSIIGVEYAYTLIDLLLPNPPEATRSPFRLTLTNEIQANKVKNYSLSVTWDIAMPKALGLDIISHEGGYGVGGTFYIDGEIKNVGEIVTEYVKVVVAAYNESGVIVDCDWGYADPSTVYPNETALFELELIHAGVKKRLVGNYTLMAESSYYLLIPEFQNPTIGLAVLMVLTWIVTRCSFRWPDSF